MWHQVLQDKPDLHSRVWRLYGFCHKVSLCRYRVVKFEQTSEHKLRTVQRAASRRVCIEIKVRLLRLRIANIEAFYNVNIRCSYHLTTFSRDLAVFCCTR